VTLWADDTVWSEDIEALPSELIREAYRAATEEQRAMFHTMYEAWKVAYPEGITAAIGAGLEQELGVLISLRTATFEQPEHGLTEEVLAQTDVLVWWGHFAHEEIADDVVERVWKRVLGGMGLIALHSTSGSKIFRRLMGTSCFVNWRVEAERELMWTVNPAHPIASGVPHPLLIPASEMYCEHFDIPAPDELVFLSTYDGEVFRSGCCFFRGAGRIFYFGPGHETYPIYHQPEVRHVLANAVQWAFNERPSPAVLTDNQMRPTGWLDQ
jgi:trehalose utilization protein